MLAASLNPATQKVSEEALRQLECNTPGFGHALLAIVDGGLINEMHIRTAAAILFKNFVRTYWPEEQNPIINADDRRMIKETIVDRLISAQVSTIEAQFVEAIVRIAAIDFPQAWPNLLPALVSKIDPVKISQTLSILRTVHQITKRYRYEARSNELYTEINVVMEQFGPVLLGLYQSLQVISDPVGMVHAQTLCNKIFYNLSFQDLPAYFEDNLAQFMGFLKVHYNYQNATILPSMEDEPGPVEQLQASVADIVNLYAGKYEEDFPMLPEFVELSWTVLTTTVLAGSRWDRVAGSAMSFLATVARQATYKDLFGPVLQLICDKVILPNMIFRDADLELFEDDPLEFLRRDQEISTDDTSVLSRRSAAVQLTRSLMEHWETEVTTILANYIQQYMDQYYATPVPKWREKDAAIQLFSAISIKGSVQLVHHIILCLLC